MEKQLLIKNKDLKCWMETTAETIIWLKNSKKIKLIEEDERQNCIFFEFKRRNIVEKIINYLKAERR